MLSVLFYSRHSDNYVVMLDRDFNLHLPDDFSCTFSPKSTVSLTSQRHPEKLPDLDSKQFKGKDWWGICFLV